MERIPVACKLDPNSLEERRKLLPALVGQVLGRRELPDGIALRYPKHSRTLEGIIRLIDLEHQCCPFLHFRLTIEPANGPVWLEITGPKGTQEFLATFL